MAVQARHFSHDLAPGAGGSLFLDEHAGCVPAPAGIGDATTVLSDFPRSELAWCNYGFLPRKRPRLEAGPAAPAEGTDFLEDQRVGMPPACTERLLPVPPFVDDVRSWAVGSGAASTSGRVANGATTVASRELLSSWTHHNGVEIDALVRLEAERMRAALQEARRRHARALLAAACGAASGRLRSSETDLERALRRNAELEEKVRQAGAECQAWVGVARSHEAVAAGLRATLDQLLLQSPCCGAAPAGGGEAEDAQSCCFEAPPAAAHATEDGGACASRSAKLACKSCGGGEACVLLLPCRHLCLCPVCEAAVDACPVCATTKKGSLHVLFS
ncbi:unnamed protein product [Miscanthus lutarioriparius]|uniref:RING-type domain-containing protein n=1 Tax=Miscanthus lutarioriparius TaxID=422564 RepID=A0A811QY74_9POAL|nr:unnamed protein product [Miscanthus lutarioriparius]